MASTPITTLPLTGVHAVHVLMATNVRSRRRPFWRLSCACLVTASILFLQSGLLCFIFVLCEVYFTSFCNCHGNCFCNRAEIPLIKYHFLLCRSWYQSDFEVLHKAVVLFNDLTHPTVLVGQENNVLKLYNYCTSNTVCLMVWWCHVRRAHEDDLTYGAVLKYSILWVDATAMHRVATTSLLQ